MTKNIKRRPPTLVLLLAVFALLVALTPLVYLWVRLGEFGIDKVLAQMLRGRTAELLGNSLLLASSVGVTALLLGSIQAWVSIRSSLKLRVFFGVTAALPLAIPSYVSAYTYTALFPGFSGFWSAWLLLSIGTAPYVYLAVSAALLRSDPATEEVARTLGAKPWRVIREVTWPSIRPAAVAGALIAALYALSDFGAVSILRYDTFTRAIYNAYRSSFDRSAAASLAGVLILVTLLILFVEAKARGGYQSAGGNYRKAVPVGLGRWALGPNLLLSAWVVLALAIPAFSLVRWSIIGSSSADLGEIIRALVNSIGYAVSGGLVTTGFAVAIGILTVRYQSRWSSIFGRLVWLTHAMPGIVVALALVFLSNRLLPGIYQTNLILLIAYLALYLPNALSAVSTPLSQAPKSLDEVAQSLGASRLSVLRKVVLPIAGPGILLATLLVTLTVLKELPATLMLRPTGIETLATRLWSETSVGAFSAAAPYALLLVLVAGIPAWLLNRQIRSTLRQDLERE